LTACSSEQTQEKEKKAETVIEHKIDAIEEAKSVVNTINEKTQEAVNDQEKESVETVQTASSTIQKAAALNGAELYKACASCHGQNAEKPALNASAIIANWESKKIEAALKGYKDGTYGRKMKGIMQAQCKTLSDEKIKVLSDYISSL